MTARSRRAVESPARSKMEPEFELTDDLTRAGPMSGRGVWREGLGGQEKTLATDNSGGCDIPLICPPQTEVRGLAGKK